MPAVSATTERRSGASASPRSVVIGGSHIANVNGPRGAASVVTGSAGSPVSSSAALAGSLIVAEARTKTSPGEPASR